MDITNGILQSSINDKFLVSFVDPASTSRANHVIRRLPPGMTILVFLTFLAGNFYVEFLGAVVDHVD
jgi:hypothetical protein